MRHTLKYMILLVALAFVFKSCELPENVNPKAAQEASAKALFSSAQFALIDHVGSSNQNTNISRLLAQYSAQTTYFSESRYNFMDRSIPDSYWTIFYRDVLNDLKEAKRVVNETPAWLYAEDKTAQLAAIEILEVYAYHVLVDAFGNIPYTEALMGSENATPAYDDAVTIYGKLITTLTNAITALDNGGDAFAEYDLMYGGDADSWKMFAASLKLRLGMRIADQNPTLAKATVESAYTAGVFSDRSQKAQVVYIGSNPYQSPLYEHFYVDNRKDFIPTNTIISKMNALTDPRMDYYFRDKKGDVYLGGVYGSKNAYNNYSHFNMQMLDATYPSILIDYMEVEFLLAEAKERTFSVGTETAEQHYNNAITASILDWGADATAAANYLAQTNVAYTTATGTWKEKIGTQKWLGLYNRGVEGWAEWRRLDFPILNVPSGLTYADIPVRMPYPYDEDNLNLENYNAASTAIGGDKVSTKLFWDKN